MRLYDGIISQWQRKESDLLLLRLAGQAAVDFCQVS